MRPERLLLGSTLRANSRPTYGDLGFASLLVAVVSGVLLALPYDVGEPYASIARLVQENPAAAWFRNLHYWSAQAFLVLTALHIWDHLRQGTERKVAPGAWARLTISIPAAGFVMLSGFMLRGDAEALQAWRIVSTVTAAIPGVGPVVSTLLFGAGEGLQILYVHHVATASIFVWLIVVEHARAVWPRAIATGVVFAPVAVLSLFAAPGLHDGLDPVVKGPWYFLGLQETLHWLTHPMLAVVAGLALLAAVFAIPRLGPRPARVMKIGLAIALGVYLALTAAGYFLRGANWSLVAPGQARGTGVVFSKPDAVIGSWRQAAHGAAREGAARGEGAPARDRAGVWGGAPREETTTPIPVVLGRPEGCLVCHAGVTGFSPSHAPEAIGCASCHAGNPFTADKAAAHTRMILVPGNLADAARACGTAECHPTVVERVNRSIMTTMAGIVAVDREVFGEPAPAGAPPPHVADLGHSPADTHLRQLCASCHVGAAKAAWGPVHEDSRGGGCTACHLNYSPEALDALRRYEGTGHAGAAREAPTVHPSLSLAIGNEHCFGCHSRSGRLSTSYEGWMESERQAPDPAAPDRYRTLEDGRVFERAEPDIHHTKKLECIDCHTAREAMGDGLVHARKWEQTEVACEDCHLVGSPATVAAASLDAESRKILTVRKRPADDRPFLAARATGQPLVNAFLDADGTARMWLKRTGEVLELRRPAAVCLQGGGHDRLSCISCHSGWAPTCSTCHTAFDPNGTGYDLLDDLEVRGEWVETAGNFRADPPALGIRAVAGRDVVDTFVPGMILTIDAGDRTGSTVHRLYARTFAHTITAKSQSCESCHSDPQALGYGRGKLTYAREGDGGRWTFAPAMPPSIHDGLPEDAWIPFLGARPGPLSTRDDVRPFSVEEQRRILAAGACLTCHQGDSRVMQDAIADWEDALRRASARCLLPAWD